jgi:hypothetical protein
MPDALLVLVPLLVLPIVLLFPFVGCGIDAVATGVFPPPNYRDYIMSVPGAPAPGTVTHPEVRPSRNDVIGYWRLVDPFPTSGAIARDETGMHHGSYVTATIAQAAPSEGSAPDPLQIATASLIVSDPLRRPRHFNGGFVVVSNDDDDLFPDQFTIEAWVAPAWGLQFDASFEHTLFSVGGNYHSPSDPGTSATGHGFSLLIDQAGNWQVRFPNAGDLLSQPLPAKPPHGPPTTHIAMTVARAGAQSRVHLFLHGKRVSAGALTVFSRPTKAPFFIGVLNGEQDPALPRQPTRPVSSIVQEVVIYRKVLSDEEIQNHFDMNKVV